MTHTTVSAKKGKGKHKKGPVHTVHIRRAENGFTVDKEHEPMPGDDNAGMWEPSKPAVFSGDNAMADAHNYSQGLFNGGADEGTMPDENASQGGDKQA